MLLALAKLLGQDCRMQTPLEHLRHLCLALPETTERLSHGEPTWFVRDKKTFATFADRHHDDRLAFWCAALPGAQQDLVILNQDQLFVPPHVGGRGWIGVRLDLPTDWNFVEDLIEDAYRMVAPRGLVAQLDAGSSTREQSTGHRERSQRERDRTGPCVARPANTKSASLGTSYD